MPEPLRRRLRPIPMLHAAALSAATLVLLTGCGTAEPSGSGPTKSAPSGSATGTADACPADDVSGARKDLVQLDMDGDGTADQVSLRTSQGCPAVLEVDQGNAMVLTAATRAQQPPVRSAFGVDVPGRQGALLVTRQEHPRGGFQLRAYGVDSGELTELQVGGSALVPFVALDVQEHPWSIDCSDGGVVFTEAVAHEPAGVMAAWDVRRTAYAIDGNAVTAGPVEELADNVVGRQLSRKFPALVRHAAFKSCRAAG